VENNLDLLYIEEKLNKIDSELEGNMINVFGYKNYEDDSDSLYNFTKYLDKIEDTNN
jgi:hypothetical protein